MKHKLFRQTGIARSIRLRRYISVVVRLNGHDYAVEAPGGPYGCCALNWSGRGLIGKSDG